MRYVILALLLLASVARAENYPLLSMERLSVAGGLEYAQRSALGSGTILGTRSEFAVGVFPAYNLTHPDSLHAHLPHVSLTGFARLGLTSHEVIAGVGLRWLIFRGDK